MGRLMRPSIRVRLQDGLVSSHFFLRRRQVTQPVFDRPFAALAWLIGGGHGCFRGRPRFFAPIGGPSLSACGAVGPSDVGVTLVSSSTSSSISSILRATSSSASSIESSWEYRTDTLKVVAELEDVLDSSEVRRDDVSRSLHDRFVKGRVMVMLVLELGLNC